jgi:phosphoadenosine phosphosulfate reductase
MNTAEKIVDQPLLSENRTPQEIFDIGSKISGEGIKLACSFSLEDIAVIDMLKSSLSHFTVFAIDTGRLNEETYEVADNISMRYGIDIKWYFPSRHAVEKLESEKGLFSFRSSLENRKECCRIRKLEPLQRALRGASAWITGMRREQSVTRSNQQPLEVDQVNGGILKINPLTFWTEADVWEYVRSKRIPVNSLYDKGYTSIGCAPCTRAIQDGESTRDGRWWWENPEHRECGLHRR